MEPDPEVVRSAVRAALREDLGDAGDVTTEAVIPVSRQASGFVIARSRLVLAGLPLAREVFRSLDPPAEFEAHRRDGDEPEAGERVATVRGAARTILMGERTALNFLMRMSGIATATRAAVGEVRGTGVRILDTRKTAPGLRRLDKYAVAIGGGVNHRMGLYDAVMIKDTHLGVSPSIGEAVARVRERGHPVERITVEVRTVEQLEEAIRAGAGRALLDNMDLATLREAARRGAGRILLEASGGLRPGALREVAETGVDFMSLGWLTHSAPAADLAMDVQV